MISDVDNKCRLQMKERRKEEQKRSREAHLEGERRAFRDSGKGEMRGNSPIFFNQVERGDFTEHAEGIC